MEICLAMVVTMKSIRCKQAIGHAHGGALFPRFLAYKFLRHFNTSH
jgi:hypothetical protein